MDTYIKNQLCTAKEYLESGVQLHQVKHVNTAISIYSTLHSMTKTNEEYNKNVKENMIRACSAMCIFDPNQALKYLDEASKYDDDHPVILNNYGFVYHKQHGDFDKSIQNYEKCLQKDPTYTTAYLGMIDVYRSLRHHKLELEYCKKGVKNCPNAAELWNSLGLSYLHNHKYKFMNLIFDCFQKGLKLEPSNETKAKILVNIGHTHGVLGDFSLAIYYYLQAIESDPKHHSAYQNILLNLHYFSDADFADENLKMVFKKADVQRRKLEPMSECISRIHVKFTEIMYPESKTVACPAPMEKPATAKIVIGYVSADLVDHAVSYFAESLLEKYSKESFEVYIYSNNLYDVGTVSKLKCTGYRCIVNQTAAVCCEQIKKDKVDILIDLSGHTSGNRLDIFALRPARICLSYLGYPHDNGFTYMNRISDEFTERCNKLQIKHNDEMSPIRLPRLFLCYSPKSVKETEKICKNYEKDEKETKSGKTEKSQKIITFGCFAKLQKINSHVIKAWKEILKCVPNSRLILKSRYFEDLKTVELWKTKFKDYSSRVIFLKGAETPQQHLEMFKLLDIHLDTFPYSGTTITTECLYMNVPVITMSVERRGIGHVQRVSGSILSSMGCNECIATDINSYVEKSVKMVDLLPTYPSVRERFLNSTITDSADFMEKFERALTDLYVERR